jgi:hypothetical protein
VNGHTTGSNPPCSILRAPNTMTRCCEQCSHRVRLRNPIRVWSRSRAVPSLRVLTGRSTSSPVTIVHRVPSWLGPLGHSPSTDRTCLVRVWSLRRQSSVTDFRLFFFFYLLKHFTLASKLLTTKCTTHVPLC